MVRPSRRGVADPSSPRPSGADFTCRDTSKGLQRGGSTSARQPARCDPSLPGAKLSRYLKSETGGPGALLFAALRARVFTTVRLRKEGAEYSDERVSVKKQSRKKDAGAVLCRRATCSILGDFLRRGDVHTHARTRDGQCHHSVRCFLCSHAARVRCRERRRRCGSRIRPSVMHISSRRPHLGQVGARP
jgi:hypothetical protein